MVDRHRDMVVLNLMFLLVYHELDSFYTKAIDNNLREVLLLLNFCYFFSLYFVPIQLHRSIVYLDKIVQRAFSVISLLIFLFATCLIFLNVGDVLATFWWFITSRPSLSFLVGVSLSGCC